MIEARTASTEATFHNVDDMMVIFTWLKQKTKAKR